ncbi:hypothetical protein NHJ13051_001741 [Beauveria bassiana]
MVSVVAGGLRMGDQEPGSWRGGLTPAFARTHNNTPYIKLIFSSQ